MKKILTLCLTIVSVTLFAQKGAIHLSEKFDSLEFPEGWTIDAHADCWVISKSSDAGGEPYELGICFYTGTPFNGKSRVISPVIDLSEVENVYIEFLHNFSIYTGVHTMGVETTSDGGATWNTVFEDIYNFDAKGKLISEITNEDFGSSTFQFCIFYEGDSFNINSWNFDNILLFTSDNFDAAVASINTNVYNSIETQLSVPITVTNRGQTVINSLEISYQFDELDPIVETFSELNLESLVDKDLEFAVKPVLESGFHILKVEILKVNGVVDDDISNNFLEKNLNIFSKSAERKVCIEQFTNSFCRPCVNVNEVMKTILEDYDGKYAYTKYHLGWPGPDLYSSSETEVRETYYGIAEIGVPTILYNSTRLDMYAMHEPEENLQVLEEALNEDAYLDLSGAFVMEGTTANISVKVETYIKVNDVRLYVIVNEKEVSEHTGSNGETEFYHVCMKMLPDASGTTFSLGSDETKIFTFSYDMSSTQVEEFDDLEVHVFVQDHNSKYIFNSCFLHEGSKIADTPSTLTAELDDHSVILNWIDTNKASDNFIVLFNNKLIAEDINTTDYTHQDVPEGEHTYGVSAVTDGYYSLPIETQLKVSYIGIDTYGNIITAYPNPANDFVYIEGVDIESIRIYNNMTQLVKNIRCNSNITQINTGDLTSGVYHIQIINKSGESFTQKLIITK